MKNVIYKIRNVVNNKFYVGSTVDSRKRFWEHRKDLRMGRHTAIALQRAWDKYGEDCFKFEIVEQLNSKEELYPAEQRWLDEHFGKDYCYNCSPNADTPMRNATPEMRAHQALKTKQWHENNVHPRQGTTHAPESIERMVANNRAPKGSDHYRYGKTVSEETRKKIGDTQRGKKKAPGRTISPEGMAKIRAAAEAGHYSHWEGRKHSEESKLKMSKQIVVVYPDGTSMLYNSITELRNETGLKPATVNRALKAKKPIGKGDFAGWEFFYAKDFFGETDEN